MASRIVLINPPVPDQKVWVREGRCQQWDIWGAPFPPLSLALISRQLVNAGFETMIIDAGPERKTIDRVLDACAGFAPLIAILATTTPTLSTDLGWFARSLKERLPAIKIVTIGIHVSALPREVLHEFAAVDYAVIGEPEISALALVEHLVRDPGAPAAVSGIAYRSADGGVVVTEARQPLEEIDRLGLPDWEKIDFTRYRLPILRRPFSLISFSRGCPFTCAFCAAHVYGGRNLRRRSVASIISEIRYNLSCGVRDFLFWTELMTFDRAYLMAFLDALQREGLARRIRWVCNGRTDAGDQTLFTAMKNAGCWQIAFGFEFGNDHILELAGKGGKASVATGYETAAAAARSGLVVDGHFIMGYPGETKATLRETIAYACSLPLTFAHFYAAVPFPGSRLYADAVSKGWVGTADRGRFNQDYASLRTGELTPADVDRALGEAYRRFYMRPQTVLRILRVPRNVAEYCHLAALLARASVSLRAKRRGE